MKLANGIFTITLAAVFSGLLTHAQTAASPAKEPTVVNSFYIGDVVQSGHDGNQLEKAVRAALPHDDIYLDNPQTLNAIYVRTDNRDDFAIAQKVIDGWPNHPNTTYRLTYTATELDGTRRMDRSEERRVGKECRSRWSPY